VMNCMKGGDFREGIRALLVDRDNSPKWQPAALNEVTPEQVNGYFQTLGENDLDVFAPIEENNLDSREQQQQQQQQEAQKQQ
jgi:hypothetical protein